MTIMAPCPRCRQRLRLQSAGRVPALLCGGCGGLWVVHDVTRQVERSGGVAAALRALADDAGRRAPLGSALGNTNLRCPWCGVTMDRLYYARAGVVLDCCSRHGTWFDRGEMQQILDVVQARHARDRGPYRSAPRAAIGLGEVLPPSLQDPK
jgi:Zn-finger nucleic acid-binding protein